MSQNTLTDAAKPKAHVATRPEETAWLERACIIVPAFDAEESIGDVVADLRHAIPELARDIIVVDDGSRDRTAARAREAGAIVISSDPDAPDVATENKGKGAALRAGFEAASERGKSVALTVDADGQHPAEEARRVLFASEEEDSLVLGIRDLVSAGAPRPNQLSNGISNYFISRFARRPLRDTQCGLRRYPVRETLSLGSRGRGYDFEAEVLLRASWKGIEIVEEPVRVLYPENRKTHFRTRRDVTRIIRTVVVALREQRVVRSD
jgi:glycosyltransferase involved in cell wall biosynthesis